MAEIIKELGRIPVSRGDYQNNAAYYRDNIVQYHNSSYQVIVDGPLVGVAPTNSSNQLNAGWTLFAGSVDAQEVIDKIKKQEAETLQAIQRKGEEFIDGVSAENIKYEGTTGLSGENVKESLEDAGAKLTDIKSRVDALKTPAAIQSDSHTKINGIIVPSLTVNQVYEAYNAHNTGHYTVIIDKVSTEQFAVIRSRNGDEEVSVTVLFSPEILLTYHSKHNIVELTTKEIGSGKGYDFTDDQIAALNSGITSEKIESYDKYSTSKQDTLQSGINIKTINGEPILGEGNIEIKGGDIQGNVAFIEEDFVMGKVFFIGSAHVEGDTLYLENASVEGEGDNQTIVINR